jgi:hypothetical protein
MIAMLPTPGMIYIKKLFDSGAIWQRYLASHEPFVTRNLGVLL